MTSPPQSPPALTGAAPPASVARSWTSGTAVIQARSDGWVELVVTGAAGPAGVPSAVTRERFTPTQVWQWIETMLPQAQRAEANGDDDSAPADLRHEAGMALQLRGRRPPLGPHIPANPLRAMQWSLRLTGCSVNATLVDGALEAVGLFAATLDSAARVARASQDPPEPIADAVAYEASQVACQATSGTLVMPLDPAPARSRSPRVSTLMRYVITSTGSVNLASIRTYPTLTEAQFSALRRAAFTWRHSPARIGGTAVPLWATREIIFLNPAMQIDSSSAPVVPGIHFRARDDGWVEMWDERTPIPVRELYRAEQLRDWADRLDRVVQRSEEMDTDIAATLPRGVTGATLPVNQWTAVLGEQPGRQVVAGMTLASVGAMQVPRLLYGYTGCRGTLSFRVQAVMYPRVLVTVARSAADAALREKSRPVPDVERGLSSADVPCTPVRMGSQAELSAADRELQVQLNLSSEAVIGFIVNARGRVAPGSIRFLTDHTQDEIARLKAALADMRYHPALLAGMPAAVRSHIVIPAASPYR